MQWLIPVLICFCVTYEQPRHAQQLTVNIPFYGFMVLLQKVALAGALFAVGLALELAGFIPPVDKTPMLAQPDSGLQLLRWLIAPVPSLLSIAGWSWHGCIQSPRQNMRKF
ncbi:MAG: MFS transporter [Pseudanabaenaceae cyanobacterium]